MRILIVDDEESARLLLARYVANDLNAEVQLAGTSVQAERLAQAVSYDAIVLDLLMPGMDGFELLRRIRAGGANVATPVIVVSVLAEDHAERRARELGADAYHLKPVRRGPLIDAIRTQLTARRR